MRQVKQIKATKHCWGFQAPGEQQIPVIHFHTYIFEISSIYICTETHAFLEKNNTQHRKYTQYLGNPS